MRLREAGAVLAHNEGAQRLSPSRPAAAASRVAAMSGRHLLCFRRSVANPAADRENSPFAPVAQTDRAEVS
jgi:hypothetical protein